MNLISDESLEELFTLPIVGCRPTSSYHSEDAASELGKVKALLKVAKIAANNLVKSRVSG